MKSYILNIYIIVIKLKQLEKVAIKIYYKEPS